MDQSKCLNRFICSTRILCSFLSFCLGKAAVKEHSLWHPTPTLIQAFVMLCTVVLLCFGLNLHSWVNMLCIYPLTMAVNDIYYVKAIRVFAFTSRCIKTYACIINKTGKEKGSVLWPCSAPVSFEHSVLHTSCLIDDLLSLDTYLMPVRLEAGRGHGFSRCLCKPYEHRVQRGGKKWVNCERRRGVFVFFFPRALFVFYTHCFLLWTRAVSSYHSNWQHERKSSVFSVAARVWKSRLAHWPIDCPDRKLKKQTAWGRVQYLFRGWLPHSGRDSAQSKRIQCTLGTCSPVTEKWRVRVIFLSPIFPPKGRIVAPTTALDK